MPCHAIHILSLVVRLAKQRTNPHLLSADLFRNLSQVDLLGRRVAGATYAAPSPGRLSFDHVASARLPRQAEI